MMGATRVDAQNAAIRSELTRHGREVVLYLAVELVMLGSADDPGGRI